MDFFRRALAGLKSGRSASLTSKRASLAPASLQFRLTAGITLVAAVGLGGVAVWTSWVMQNLLVTAHLQTVESLADRLPRDIEVYREMLPIEMAVERALQKADIVPVDSTSSLLIWIRRPDGSIMTKSQSLQLTAASFQTMLMTLTDMPLQAQVYQVDSRYFVLSSTALAVDRTAIGQLFIAQDITQEQQMLAAVIRQVSAATILAIVLMMVALALYIRRSLQPLRRLSQLAEAISADELSQARLHLDRAPTEVQELAQMLDAMLARLSQSWEQQRQFVSNVSHELRTPLSIVSGYLQSLQRRSSNLSSSQQEALEIATSETNRTIRMLQDLLDLARADSGYLHFHFEWIVLNDLVHEIVGMGKRFSDRTITVNAQQPAIQIKTDRDRFTQVLINLIDNAVKYSDPKLPIVVELVQTEEHTTIEVIDQGCGISLQQQARIFERFYRVDEARSTEGVGLGLAIVKSLVEGLQGHVAVCSKLGKGSSFTVTLPNHPTS